MLHIFATKLARLHENLHKMRNTFCWASYRFKQNVHKLILWLHQFVAVHHCGGTCRRLDHSDVVCSAIAVLLSLPHCHMLTLLAICMLLINNGFDTKANKRKQQCCTSDDLCLDVNTPLLMDQGWERATMQALLDRLLRVETLCFHCHHKLGTSTCQQWEFECLLPPLKGRRRNYYLL